MVKDRFPSDDPTERLGTDDIELVLSKTGCDGIGMSPMCCERKIMTGVTGVLSKGFQTKK